MDKGVSVDGKFFKLGGASFTLKGVTYGPFAEDSNGDSFGSREMARSDFERIAELRANALRVYHVPPAWFLDLAIEHGLRLLIDLPWNKHLCFLDRPEWAANARETVRESAKRCAAHPAVFAVSVVNEIPSDIVRWSGAAAVSEFIDSLIEEVKTEAADTLCTFGNFPPTEFLRPRNVDFHCFNVYLHQNASFANYLARLQMLAEAKPLVLGETGMDVIREGEERVAEHLGSQIELVFRSGLAGCFVFSFTDEWERGGVAVEDWAFGLTTRDRKPRRSFAVVQKRFAMAPHFPLESAPKVTVVIAAFNAARTLEVCLRSVSELNYPDYEVLLVDDGSTDATARITKKFPRVRLIQHGENLGLSEARNTGTLSARGEVIAFTDADCRPDKDWLYYVVADLVAGRFVGIGGHNLLPSDDSAVASVVMVSPGGPAHVMLTDQLAEHIPGCNMAFYKWALLDIGGFDPVFRKAGDDVDVCWRLQQRGYNIGFSAAGFVWHYRRSTVRDYLNQQLGYGEAEALLVRKHPEYFNRFGGNIWHGRIYSAAKMGIVTRPARIYHGRFGTGLFQTLYAPSPNLALMLCTSFEYHVLATLPLLVLASIFHLLLPLALASLTLSLALCLVAAAQADIPKRQRKIWSRPLAALLFVLQPIWRGWARYRGRLRNQAAPTRAPETAATAAATRFGGEDKLGSIVLFDERGRDRTQLLREIISDLEAGKWQYRMDGGWNQHDVEIFGSRWSRVMLGTVAEDHGHGSRLFRCRLTSGWTFLARITFWSLLGLQAIALGFAARALPALWTLLVSLPIFYLWVLRDQRRLKRMLSGFLAETGRRLGMTPVSSKNEDSR